MLHRIYYTNIAEMLLHNAEMDDLDADRSLALLLEQANLSQKKRDALMEFRRRVGRMRDTVDAHLTPSKESIGDWLIQLALQDGRYDGVLAKEADTYERRKHNLEHLLASAFDSVQLVENDDPHEINGRSLLARALDKVKGFQDEVEARCILQPAPCLLFNRIITNIRLPVCDTCSLPWKNLMPGYPS